MASKIRVMPFHIKCKVYDSVNYHLIGSETPKAVLVKLSEFGYENVGEVFHYHENGAVTYTVIVENEDEHGIVRRGYVHFNIPSAEYKHRNAEWFWYFD